MSRMTYIQYNRGSTSVFDIQVGRLPSLVEIKQYVAFEFLRKFSIVSRRIKLQFFKSNSWNFIHTFYVHIIPIPLSPQPFLEPSCTLQGLIKIWGILTVFVFSNVDDCLLSIQDSVGPVRFPITSIGLSGALIVDSPSTTMYSLGRGILVDYSFSTSSFVELQSHFRL